MSDVTPLAHSRAGVSLNLIVGVIGSTQELSRLKAKLELAVEDALQELSLEASIELGIEIGRWTIATSISQPEGYSSASRGPLKRESANQLGGLSGPASSVHMKAGLSL